jgi:two-component system phosphate regulon response regulator PhoB
MNRRTVLVVEDDATIRELLTELLDDAGYAVVEAACGQAALQLAQEHGPSVVLVDQMLPDMSGLDVLTQLRTHHATRDMPVMLVSGRLEQLTAGAHGADCVLAKPFDIGVLLEHVGYLASHPRARVA